MKALIAALFLAATFMEPLHAADQNAKLTKVSITFRTHDDNKDHDTRLSVAIKNKVSVFLSQELASGDNLGGDKEFKDPGSESFDLVVKSSNITLKDVTLPLVNIHIEPNGNDRWIFDYTVTLNFEDGSVFTSKKDGVILDQNNKDFTGVFEG
jgi:hypothetical protein